MRDQRLRPVLFASRHVAVTAYAKPLGSRLGSKGLQEAMAEYDNRHVVPRKGLEPLSFSEPELVDLTPAPAPALAELRKATLPDEPALVHRLIRATRPRGTRGWPLPGSVAPPMGSRRVLAIAALRNPVRSDHGAGVHRSIRRAAAAKLELRARGRTGRDSSLFVRRQDSLDGGARVHPRALLSGLSRPPKLPEYRAHTGLTPDFY